MKFLEVKNKDASNAYVAALLSAGFGQVGKLNQADFILYDIERPNRYELYRDFLENHCGFIYPHTPYSSYFHWDGIYSPLPVQCNFVVAPGAKRALESINYPSRVEVVGFSHCEVKPFSPTAGKKALLIVPRPQGGGKYVCWELYGGLVKVVEFLKSHVNDFEQITIQHTPDHWDALQLPYSKKFDYTVNDPRHDDNPSQYIAELVDQYDLVFGIGTAAYIALARGKPTVMWGNDLTPRTTRYLAQHPHKYMRYFRYPLDFEKMSFDEMLEVTQNESREIKRWKADNIGGNFDKDKFIRIVKESLAAFKNIAPPQPVTIHSNGKKPRFYATENPDHDGLFIEALLGEGFTRVRKLADADFIFHDSVHPEVRDFLHRSPFYPNFTTPHTPQSWFIWDGIQPARYTCCNFVSGPVGVKGMAAYGYPYRVEAVGFTRCKVREFSPTKGNDLLIVPAHPDRRGRYAQPNYMDIVTGTFDRIIKNRSAFGKITLCWMETRLESELKDRMQKAGFTFIYADPFIDRTPLLNMMERIERADLVIGCGTTGCVSVAMGKPTVFFSEVGIPYSPPRPAKNSHLYLSELRFPLMAENMMIEDILAVRDAPNPKAEHWKEQNIGGDFNPEKVISVVREHICEQLPVISR